MSTPQVGAKSPNIRKADRISVTTVPFDQAKITLLTRMSLQSVLQGRLIKTVITQLKLIRKDYLTKGMSERIPQEKFDEPAMSALALKISNQFKKTGIFSPITRREYLGSSVDITSYSREELLIVANQLGLRLKGPLTVGALRKKIKDNLVGETGQAKLERFISDEVTTDFVLSELKKLFPLEPGELRLPFTLTDFMGHALPHADAKLPLLLASGEIKPASKLTEDSSDLTEPAEEIFATRGRLDCSYGLAGVLIPVENWRKAADKGRTNELLGLGWDDSNTIYQNVDLSRAIIFCPSSRRDKLLLDLSRSSSKLYEENVLFYNEGLFTRTDLPREFVATVPGFSDHLGAELNGETLMNVLFYYFFTSQGKKEMLGILQNLFR